MGQQELVTTSGENAHIFEKDDQDNSGGKVDRPSSCRGHQSLCSRHNFRSVLECSTYKKSFNNLERGGTFILYDYYGFSTPTPFPTHCNMFSGRVVSETERPL